MKKVNTIDLKYFKKYVETYDESNFEYNVTFIRDMLYGIGISVDVDKYKMADGFRKFEDLLLDEVIVHRKLLLEINRSDILNRSIQIKFKNNNFVSDTITNADDFILWNDELLTNLY